MTLSLPVDPIRELDEFLEKHGKVLGYREGRGDFILTAIREKRERDEARLLRMRTLAKSGALDDDQA